jgi:ankyrin repeat protein
MKAGASLSTPLDLNGNTAFHYAARSGRSRRTHAMEWLFTQGADMTCLNNRALTPINLAAFDGNLEAVKWLVAHGAAFTLAECKGCTPLHCAAVMGHLSTMEWLLKEGADLTVIGLFGGTPLQCAALNGHVAAMELLVLYGAEVDATDEAGATALHVAAGNDQVGAMHWLVEHGADMVATRHGDGSTPLDHATVEGHADAAAWLANRIKDASTLHACTSQSFKSTVDTEPVVSRLLQLRNERTRKIAQAKQCLCESAEHTSAAHTQARSKQLKEAKEAVAWVLTKLPEDNEAVVLYAKVKQAEEEASEAAMSLLLAEEDEANGAGSGGHTRKKVRSKKSKGKKRRKGKKVYAAPLTDAEENPVLEAEISLSLRMKSDISELIGGLHHAAHNLGRRNSHTVRKRHPCDLIDIEDAHEQLRRRVPPLSCSDSDGAHAADIGDNTNHVACSSKTSVQNVIIGSSVCEGRYPVAGPVVSLARHEASALSIATEDTEANGSHVCIEAHGTCPRACRGCGGARENAPSDTTMNMDVAPGEGRDEVDSTQDTGSTGDHRKPCEVNPEAATGPENTNLTTPQEEVGAPDSPTVLELQQRVKQLLFHEAENQLLKQQIKQLADKALAADAAESSKKQQLQQPTDRADGTSQDFSLVEQNRDLKRKVSALAGKVSILEEEFAVLTEVTRQQTADAKQENAEVALDKADLVEEMACLKQKLDVANGHVTNAELRFDDLQSKFELLEQMFLPVQAENEERKHMLAEMRQVAIKISRSRQDLDLPTTRMGELNNVRLAELGISTEEISLLQDIVCDPNFHPWRVQKRSVRGGSGDDEVETVVNWADERLQALVRQHGSNDSTGQKVAHEALRCNKELQQWNPSGGYCVTIPYHNSARRELRPGELLQLAAGIDVPGCRPAVSGGVQAASAGVRRGGNETPQRRHHGPPAARVRLPQTPVPHAGRTLGSAGAPASISWASVVNSPQ